MARNRGLKRRLPPLPPLSLPAAAAFVAAAALRRRRRRYCVFFTFFFRETYNNYCRINGMLLSRAAAERERVESGELSEDC